MAINSAPESSLLSLLYRSYPAAISPDETDLDLFAANPKIFPRITYTDAESADIKSWLSANLTSLQEVLGKDDKAAISSQLASLNSHLATRTTILGNKPSVADVAIYALLAPVVEKWSPEERTGEQGYHHIVRHVDFVQNSRVFSLQIPEEEKVGIDVNDVKFVPKPIDLKAEKERKKKEKAAAEGAAGAEKTVVVGQTKPEAAAPEAAAAGKAEGKPKEKKQKKEKAPKPAPAPAAPPSPSLIDLRVGHILRAINHPNADSLYVSTIDCGDAPGSDNTSLDEETGKTVRTVCSGLNGLVPLAEMQGRKIVAVCNLKPVTMRGIKSAAMVLAASPRVAEGEDSHAGPVELVTPPADAPAGDRIYFDGWEGEPEKQLNPKKKVWETFQPGFTTTDGLEVAFESGAVPVAKEQEGKPALGKLLAKSGGVCTVKSLKGATVR